MPRRRKPAKAKRRLHKASHNRGQKPWQPVKMKLFELPPLLPDDCPREKRIDILRSIGKQAKEEFEQKYPSIARWFQEYDAPYLLAFCARYFLSHPEGTDPEAFEGELDFYHHYLEIMQAFSLMYERSYSPKPLAGKVVALRTEMQQLGQLMAQREFYVPDDITDQELHEHILLSSMRNQTAAIRNWAYPQQMLALVRGLVEGVVDPFYSAYGMDPQSLVDLFAGIIQRVDEKLNSHVTKVRSFMRYRNARKIVKAYNSAWPELKPIDDVEANRLYAMSGESCINLKAMLLAHSDLRLEEIYSFRREDLSGILGNEAPWVALQKILDAWSFGFGDLKDHKIEYFVLGNPVLRKPFVKLDDNTYFCPTLGILPHLALGLIEDLISVSEPLRAKYDRYKSDFLEDTAANLLSKSFPNGDVFRRSLWEDLESGQQGENDLTVIIDSFALVVECKAGGISDPAKRGAPLRFKRTLQDLVLEPTDQAHRFIAYLSKDPGIHVLRTRTGADNRIDTTKVRYYVPLSLTIEDLGLIGSNIKEAIAAGLIERDIESVAPSMSVAALECVFELLDNEVERIHYLSRRREFEHHVDYYADELDLLGLYLDNGFNIGSAEYEKWHMNLASKSKELDPYFTAKAVGKTVPKPSRRLTKWWRDIIARVCEKRPEHWIELGFMLLNSTQEDQEKFEHELFCLKSRIRTSRTEHPHNWISFLSGPERRRYLIAGFPYRKLSRPERNGVMQKILSRECMEQVRGAVVLGVNIDTTEYPYSFIAAAKETRLQDAPYQSGPAQS